MSDVSIEIENVRCFRERTVVPLAPLTLVVGENSTGKSTFLSMIRLASDIGNREIPTDFNEEPFPLGTFENILSAKVRGRIAERFSIGMEKPINQALEGLHQRTTGMVNCRGVFTNHESQPGLHSWAVESAPYRIEVTFGKANFVESVQIEYPEGHSVLRFSESRAVTWYWREYSLPSVGHLIRDHAARQGKRTPSSEDIENIYLLGKLWEAPQRPLAIAPIRTRPQRTYDLLTDFPHPEGGHVPMVLAKTLAGNNSHRLKSAINSFGQASGLYEKMKIKTLGDDASGPFQIHIDFGGSQFNLIDTGYGISQVLPILVEALRSEQGSRLLIQQPEVHLHPRAQAELGSLLLHLANEEDKSFVIETHSDYLIDRVRAEVRESGIEPAKVRILYFERQDPYRVQVFPMSIDEEGNLLDAPPTYRRFFLEEERRFLGV